MAKDIETLKQQALQIKNEVEDGANTADRVGGMFSDMLDYNDEKLTELSSKVIILKSVTSEAITSGNTGVEKVGDYYY